MGILTKLMRQLYQSIAIPKFTYGADIWFRPLFKDDTGSMQRGSKGIMNRLTSVQRIAAISITGAMRTTPTDSLEAHANLLPISILMQKICHHATVRLASLPQSHPLHKKLTWIARHNVQHHRSSLHNLLHTFRIYPSDVKTRDPAKIMVSTGKSVYQTRIATTKAEAIREQQTLTDRIQIFTDGSGYQGRIGTAAVLIREGQEPRALRYHLGSDEEHTVYEAELLGLTLAAHLLATERNPIYPTSILADNQATIHTGEVMNKTGSGYITDQFERMTKCLAKQREARDDFKLTVHWVPGHMKVAGNELVDKEAKDTAKGN